MTVAEITAKVHRLTKTDNATYPDTDILIDLNLVQGEMVMDILKVQNYRNFETTQAYTDLISTTGLSEGDVGYEGEYPFPTDLLRPKRIEVKFDGEDSTPVLVYDSSENTKSEYEDLDENWKETKPYVKIERDSYFIRPTPDTTVTDGIHIWYEPRQSDVTTGTPLLEVNFHRIYPLLVAVEFGLEKPDRFNPNWELQIEKIKRDIFSHYRNKFNYRKTLIPQRENNK